MSDPGPIRSARQHAPADAYDTVVIGSGIGGLTTAAILAGEGQRVCVLERHYTAGGFTHVFHRRDFEWDVGIHYIGGMTRRRTALRRVFDHVTGGTIEWADMGDVYDRMIFGDETYDYRAGREAFVAGMRERFPSDADGRAIERYVELVLEAGRAAAPYFAERALPRPLSMLVGRRWRAPFLQFARRTTLEVMRELTDNAELIGVLLGQLGDYGLPPARSSFAMHAMVAGHYLDGAAYPVGGCAQIAEAIAARIAEAGGAVFTCAEVDRIVVQRGRARGVRLAGGREIVAPRVVSGAGVATTYETLLDPDVVDRHGLGSARDATAPSVAHLGVYLGFKRTAAQLGLERTNLWIYPGHDHDENIRNYLADPAAPLPVVYASFPSAKDPDWERRHPGTATVDLITLAPYERFARWEDGRWRRRGEAYDALKRELADRMIAELDRVCPQLRGRAELAEVSTPLSTRHFVNYRVGEIYGLEHTPARFERRDLRPATPIKGLWLTGQDVVTCGVGGAMMGGVLTASAMQRTNFMRRIVRDDRARQSRAA